MRIGIVVTCGPRNGGTYWYSLSVLNALRDYGHGNDYFVFYQEPDFPVEQYNLSNWKVEYLDKRNDHLLTRVAKLISTFDIPALAFLARGRYKTLLKYNLDLVVCPATTLAAWWCGYPFIVAIHDVWHRRQLHKFPRGSWFSEPFRDLIWNRAAKSARLILVESEMGRAEATSAYGVSKEKTYLLPTGPGPFIWNYDLARLSVVRAKYDLPECYVFYPAMVTIWKNQLRIIEAISILNRQHNLNIHAVFVGPMGKYGEQLKNTLLNKDIEKFIHFLGPVPDGDMALLYLDALCLVMASYLGPTNMPIWEAFAVGCPVISSNAGAMPNQVADAGLLFDPSDAGQLAECILQLYRDQAKHEILVRRGFDRIAQLRPEIWAQSLLQAISEAVT